jgi:hypothetical protein
MFRTRLSPLLLVPIAVALVVLLSSAAGAKRAAVAAAKQFTSQLSYHETNSGRSQGSATIGIQGRGSFSVKLGPHAAAEAAFIALVTGVPATKIASGGTYTVQRDIAASGLVTGVVVARFKAKGLGVACVSYTEKPGKYVPGSSFVPMSGSFKTVGGVGPAAGWRVNVSFTETSVTGATIEQLGARGSEQASVGKAKPMTAACKRVAAIK